MNSSPHGEARPARLLVVDDDEGVLFLLEDILRREGYEVHGVDCGKNALVWLQKNDADLLLLDLKLPDFTAPALIEQLKAAGQDVAFIVITGNGDERTAVEVMKKGALDYVMKGPGLLELLPSTVRRALETVKKERELRQAYQSIHERQTRYEEAIRTALDGFARLDRDGRFLEVNHAMSDLMGYPEEEVLTMSLFGAGTGLLPRDVTERILKLPPGGFARLFTQIHRPDGTETDVSLSVRCGEGELFTFVHDLSEQRRLERNLLEITENERRRFGNDLHDSLGQCLTAVELISYSHAQDALTAAPHLAKAAETINTYIREAGQQARKIAHGMAPVGIDGDGLMTALNNLAQQTTRAGISCDFDCNPPVYMNDPQIATHLFRIAQEGVNNALKYSCAKRVKINLEERGDRYQLTIEDNGLGFALANDKLKYEGHHGEDREGDGMGLQVMDYRAKLMGGELHVESAAEKGVRIVCSVPIRH